MANTRLFQAVCAAAMLAAAPAFAQTDTQPADTGAHNSVNAPESPSADSTMAPAGKMGGSDSMSRRHHATGAMHARNDTSQDAAVDQLNDQSYQAAQRGEAFNGGASSTGSMAPAGAGHMNSMSGGSPSDDTAGTSK